MTYGGDAIGRVEDGKPVFVPFVMPGERVRVRVPVERSLTATPAGRDPHAFTPAHHPEVPAFR